MNDHLPHGPIATAGLVCPNQTQVDQAWSEYMKSRALQRELGPGAVHTGPSPETLLKLTAADMRAKHDAVHHPKHYTSHPSGVECIQITEHFGFNLGNVLKYLWRADEKGAPLQDLEKAKWYLEREIQKRKRETDNQRREG